jgi:hypothetical protein
MDPNEWVDKHAKFANFGFQWKLIIYAMSPTLLLFTQ